MLHKLGKHLDSSIRQTHFESQSYSIFTRLSNFVMTKHLINDEGPEHALGYVWLWAGWGWWKVEPASFQWLFTVPNPTFFISSPLPHSFCTSKTSPLPPEVHTGQRQVIVPGLSVQVTSSQWGKPTGSAMEPPCTLKRAHFRSQLQQSSCLTYLWSTLD